METNKIIRTVCFFTESPKEDLITKLKTVSNLLTKNNFLLQTQRICSKEKNILNLEKKFNPRDYFLSIGTLTLDQASSKLEEFLNSQNTAFNLDLTTEKIDEKSVDILLNIIKSKPKKTFSFAYVFNNAESTPFFPSANYSTAGFSIGLQPTNLSIGCKSLNEWLLKVEEVWKEIFNLFKNNSEFLGIDSSIAPLNDEDGSFVGFLKRLNFDFSYSTTTNIYLEITNFLKKKNPKPIGLCGLMLPCLEDKYLALEYNQGNFSIERNVFLSLHSGLGIDTYPIGIDEKRERIIDILKLIQGLSNKYKKPLSIRFVCDGKSKIGDNSDFQNQYLQDVLIRLL